MSPVNFDAGSVATNKYAVGIDIGSTFSKAVIVSDNTIRGWAVIASGGDYRIAANEVLDKALSKAGIFSDNIACIVATGYGAASVLLADESVSDMTCQGRGISYLFPSARTVVDIGGQYSRVFRVDKEGRVVNFVFSEQCAAGSARLLQVIARVLQVGIDELGELSLKSRKKVDFTTSCAVFIESELISRIAEDFLKEDIAAGIHRALAAKIQVLVERVGLEMDCALVGGGTKNIGLVRSIEEGLGIKTLIPEEPQIIAALGAALIAQEKVFQAV